jgi:hypothetical protein
MKSIAGPSTTKITVTRVSTTSTITIGLPSDVQLSNPPLSGSFRIKCLLEDGITYNYTVDIPVLTGWTSVIRDKIGLACP